MSERLFGGRIGGRHAVEFGVKTNKVNQFLKNFSPFWLEQSHAEIVCFDG
jgi:hypothetical protein